MSKRDYRLFLEDIIEEIDRINRFIKNVSSPEELEENEMVLYAILKSFENIGEAVKNLPSHIRENYPYQWKKIAGLRDIISHEYWGIDTEIIFSIIETKLPELKKVVSEILEKEYKKWKW